MNKSKEWEEDCLEIHGVLLIGDFCHWCMDWDQMPLDETCGEFAFCSCIPFIGREHEWKAAQEKMYEYISTAESKTER